MDLNDEINAINTHFNDQWAARRAETFREMSRDRRFGRAARRKYRANAEKAEREGGR